MSKNEEIKEENVADSGASHLPQHVVKQMLETQKNLNAKIAETVKDIYFELDVWENSIYDTFETAQSAMTGIELERRKLHELTKVGYKAICCLKKKSPICQCGKKIFPDQETEYTVKLLFFLFYLFLLARSQKTPSRP